LFEFAVKESPVYFSSISVRTFDRDARTLLISSDAFMVQ